LIDADTIDKWLNLLEGYFSVHNFSNREKITFALLKAIPHVKDWWDTYSKQRAIEEFAIFVISPTWDSFQDAIKEKYYHVGSYEDYYTNGPPCVKKGTRQYHISPIFSILCAQSWVSKTLSDIWCSNTTIVFIDTFE
jgi:hypothetical protein